MSEIAMEYLSDDQDQPQAPSRRKRKSISDSASAVEDGQSEEASSIKNPVTNGTAGSAKAISEQGDLLQSNRPPNKPLRRDNVYTYDISCLDNIVPILLGVGQFETETFSRQVKGRDDVYCRKENGTFFRVEQLFVGDTGLRVGDEVLVINGFKLEAISSIVAVGMLLEQAVGSGHVKISVSRPKRSTSLAAADFERPVLEPVLDVEPRSAEIVDHTLSNIVVRNGSNITSSSTTLTTNHRPFKDEQFEDGLGAPYIIELMKVTDGKNLGLGIVGGLDAPKGPIGFYVKTIYPNGLAAEDGRLGIGDELIALNGEQLGGLRHREAVSLFQKLQPGIIQLTVRSRLICTSAASLNSEAALASPPIAVPSQLKDTSRSDHNEQGRRKSEDLREAISIQAPPRKKRMSGSDGNDPNTSELTTIQPNDDFHRIRGSQGELSGVSSSKTTYHESSASSDNNKIEENNNQSNYNEYSLINSKMTMESSQESEGIQIPQDLQRNETAPLDNLDSRFGLRASAFIEEYPLDVAAMTMEAHSECFDEDLPPSLPLSAAPPPPFSLISPPSFSLISPPPAFASAPPLPSTSAPELPSSPPPNVYKFHEQEAFEDDDFYAASNDVPIQSNFYSAQVQPISTAQSMTWPSLSLQSQKFSNKSDLNEDTEVSLQFNGDATANYIENKNQVSENTPFVESNQNMQDDNITDNAKRGMVKQSSDEFSSYVSLIQGSGYRAPKLGQFASTGMKSISFQKNNTSVDNEDGERAIAQNISLSPPNRDLTNSINDESNDERIHVSKLKDSAHNIGMSDPSFSPPMQFQIDLSKSIRTQMDTPLITAEQHPNHTLAHIPVIMGEKQPNRTQSHSPVMTREQLNPTQLHTPIIIGEQQPTSSTSTLNNLSEEKMPNISSNKQSTNILVEQPVPQSMEALSKFRRSLTQDEMISNVMKDYYTVVDDPIPVEEVEKKKPTKPLIAQALLPKSTRRPSVPLSSGIQPTVASSPLSPMMPVRAATVTSATISPGIQANTSSDIQVNISSDIQENRSFEISNETFLSQKGTGSNPSEMNGVDTSVTGNRLNSVNNSTEAIHKPITFQPDAKSLIQRGSLNESNSYIMSKFLEDDENRSSKGSVCSSSEMEGKKDVEYGVNVGGAKAFFESLKSKPETSKSTADASLVIESDSGSVKSADMDSVSMATSIPTETRSSGVISPPSETKSIGITLSKALSMSLSDTKFSPKSHSPKSQSDAPTWHTIDSGGSLHTLSNSQPINNPSVKAPSPVKITPEVVQPSRADFTDNTLAHISESKAFFENIKRLDSTKQTIKNSNVESDQSGSVGLMAKADSALKSTSHAEKITSSNSQSSITLPVSCPAVQTENEILEEELAKVNQSKAFFESLKPRQNKPMARAASVQINRPEIIVSNDNGRGTDPLALAGKEGAVSQPVYRRGSLQAAKHPGLMKKQVAPTPPSKSSSSSFATITPESGSSINSRTPSLTMPDVFENQQNKPADELPSVESLVSKFASLKTSPEKASSPSEPVTPLKKFDKSSPSSGDTSSGITPSVSKGRSFSIPTLPSPLLPSPMLKRDTSTKWKKVTNDNVPPKQ